MTESDFLRCYSCGNIQRSGFRFCSACGALSEKAANKKIERDEFFVKNLKSLSIYVLLIIVLLIASSFTEGGLNDLILWTVVFAIIDLVFSFVNIEVWKLWKFDMKHWWLLPLLVLLGGSTAVLVNVFLGGLQFLLEDVEILEYTEVYLSAHPVIYGAIFIAAFPAIFEELAFRGFVFQNIKSISNTNSAIYGSAFIFALVHFSLYSLIWIFPFGILLGYLRRYYNSLLPGVILHFTHNLVILLIDYNTFNSFQNL